MRKFMVYLCIIFACLCVASFCLTSCVKHDEAKDAAEILAIIDEQFEAFNRHDAAAVVAPAVENYENWDRSVINKADKMESVQSLFDRNPNIQSERIKYVIVFVTPEVAIYKDIAMFTNMIGDDGEVLPPDYELWAGIWVKKNGEWVEVASFCTEISEADVAASLN